VRVILIAAMRLIWVDTDSMLVYSLRWDHANMSLYRNATGCYLPFILQELSFLENTDNVNAELLEGVYRWLVKVLSFCSKNTIPLQKNTFSSFGGTKSQTFDKMNHHALFIRLMQRHVPLNVLCILKNWFSICATCVKWGSTFSRFFTLSCGIRQGGGFVSVSFCDIY